MFDATVAQVARVTATPVYPKPRDVRSRPEGKVLVFCPPLEELQAQLVAALPLDQLTPGARLYWRELVRVAVDFTTIRRVILNEWGMREPTLLCRLWRAKLGTPRTHFLLVRFILWRGLVGEGIGCSAAAVALGWSTGNQFRRLVRTRFGITAEAFAQGNTVESLTAAVVAILALPGWAGFDPFAATERPTIAQQVAGLRGGR